MSNYPTRSYSWTPVWWNSMQSCRGAAGLTCQRERWKTLQHKYTAKLGEFGT